TGEPVAPPAGDGGGGAVPADGQPPAPDAAQGSEPGPGTGALDATTLNDSWGKIATSFETQQTEYLRQGALAEVRKEYPEYFERLEKHPRLLVGQEVQSLTGEGKERLKDTADAREW